MAKQKQSAHPELDELTGAAAFKADLYFSLQAVVFAVILLVLFSTLVGRLVKVDGRSMEPTLHDRDTMLLQSLGYTPRQGDVVVLTKPFASITGPIVKRVIATGGQSVEIDYAAETVTVDGVVLDEPYIKESMLPLPPERYQSSVVVPEGSVFVMGDNRNNSSDSRCLELGTVDERRILGRAVMVVFPFQDFGLLH